MRGVFPVCVFSAWTPSLADRQMLSAFFVPINLQLNDKLAIITKASQFGWSSTRMTAKSKTQHLDVTTCL